MNIDQLKAQIESFLFAWGESISQGELSKLLQIDKHTLQSVLKEMQEEYEAPKRGLRLIFLEKHVQLVVKTEHFKKIQSFFTVNKDFNLSRSALELLSIIAYKQPITKGEIEEIRGVKSDSLIQKLLEMDFIKITGKKKVPGRPFLYGTTVKFLKLANVEKISQLPQYYELKMKEVPQLDATT